MFIPIAPPLMALILSSSLVSATRFCQCENPSYDRKFGGIQYVCSGMSQDWCSTNCNVFGYNCDYCQFTPAGYGTDADFATLKTWCGQQEGYDSGKQLYYKGTDVFCYSYKNRVEQGSQGGCTHENNGDWPLPPDKVRDATVDFRYPYNGVYVKRVCEKLLRKDGPLLVQGYLNRHDDCKWVKNETTLNVIECPYKRGFGTRQGLLSEFKDDCAYYGGQWYALSNGPALAAMKEHVGGAEDQKVLRRPQRMSLDEEIEDFDPPEDPGDKYPPGPGDTDQPDDPSKHDKDDFMGLWAKGDDSEERKVIYEHEEVKITFVD